MNDDYDKEIILELLERKPNRISDNFEESLDVDPENLERNLYQLEQDGLITKNDEGKNEEFPVFNLTENGKIQSLLVRVQELHKESGKKIELLKKKLKVNTQ